MHADKGSAAERRFDVLIECLLCVYGSLPDKGVIAVDADQLFIRIGSISDKAVQIIQSETSPVLRLIARVQRVAVVGMLVPFLIAARCKVKKRTGHVGKFVHSRAVERNIRIGSKKFAVECLVRIRSQIVCLVPADNCREYVLCCIRAAWQAYTDGVRAGASQTAVLRQFTQRPGLVALLRSAVTVDTQEQLTGLPVTGKQIRTAGLPDRKIRVLCVGRKFFPVYDTGACLRIRRAEALFLAACIDLQDQLFAARVQQPAGVKDSVMCFFRAQPVPAPVCADKHGIKAASFTEVVDTGAVAAGVNMAVIPFPV